MFEFKHPFRYKIIYIFSIDDQAHRGLLKIGETTLESDAEPSQSEIEAAANRRIKQFTSTAAIGYKLLHVETAVDLKGKTFSDRDVHNVLKRSNHRPHKFEGSAAREWFRIDLSTARAAVDAVKRGRFSLSGSEKFFATEKIEFRDEQREAIAMAVKHLKGKKETRVLWNAKMRFGKTLCALEVVRLCGFKRTIIVTHRPVVNKGWLDDFDKIFGGTDYFYSSQGNGEPVEKLIGGDAPFVYFASMQDLRGSKRVGGEHDKNALVFDADWDLIIVDEAHEGIKTALGDKVIAALKKHDTDVLMLSGTPFNLAEDFEEASTFTWSYVDEQRAKKNFADKRPDEHNPYAELPRMNIFTYDLARILKSDQFLDVEDKAFNFTEFFRVENERFVHQNAVKNFLDLLCRSDDSTRYPFSTEHRRSMFRHTFWLVPGVKEAKALAEALRRHAVFGEFKIINVAGSEEIQGDPLDQVRREIKLNDWTITLSCGRLTAGVTVPEWTAVFMLSGGEKTSAISYMQTIFRVQSPCKLDGRIKTDCFVFDFAPLRTLEVLADAVTKNRVNTRSKTDRELIDEFLNFAPVISFDGSRMQPFCADDLFQRLKRVYSERVFKDGFDSPLLFNRNVFDADPKLQAALKKIIEPRAPKRIVVNDQGLAEKKTRSKREPKPVDTDKKNARDFIKLLRAVSIRLPLMIYGANVRDDLISIERITSIVDDRSWEEFMPRGLSKEMFRELVRYYDEDVFAAAAQRIRKIVRAADELEPNARVKAITDLMSTFKNPDKETVLTPWSVVLLHLDLTLGADKTFFEREATVLDINSKTGLYPLRLALSFWEHRCGVVKKMFGRALEFKEALDLWRAVVRENIFALCRTPMAAAITRRTLLGFDDAVTPNIQVLEDIVELLRDCFELKDFEPFASKLKSRSFWHKGARGKLKFDAVVGNPPYQQETGNYAKPVYHTFIESVEALTDRAALIHPARFLFDAGGTPKDWNKKILLDKRWRVVQYKANSQEFFPSSDIKGGVAITQYDANADFGSIDVFIPFDELRSIHQKVVVDNKNFEPLNSIIYPQTIYRLTKKFHEENPWAIERLTKGHENDVSTIIFERLPEIFTLKKPDDDREYLKVFGLHRTKRTHRYVRRDYVTDHETIEKYKVFVPTANGSGSIGETLSSPLVGSPLVGSPLVITTETFISVGSFEIISEAEAAFKYIKTKFCRAMLGILKVTQHNTPQKWAKVPLQDFSARSDIDWRASIPEIDRQLYRKYGLSETEIAFIEARVRAMD